VLSGAASVTASSYGSWIADTQQDDPVGAFDGNPATAWAEGSEQTPVGQWLQIGFSGPLDLPSKIGIRLLDDSTAREIASVLRVSTAAGTAVTDVAATGAVQPLNVPPGRTGWLRITIAAAQRVTLGYPGAGISDVLIPGVKVTRLLQPAQDPAGQQAAATVFSFSQPVPSPFTFADPAATAPMARTFTTAAPAALQLQAAALALPGPGLDALLDSLIRPPGAGLLQVAVASTPGAQPAGFPASLISGTAAMPWTADTASPVIHLAWPGKRGITSLIVRPAAGLPSTPLTVQITSPDGTRQASIGPGGLVTFSRLTTDRIDVSFPRVRQATIVTSTGQLETLPVRLTQLSVPALAGLRPVLPDQQAPVTLACGQGPALTIDGRAYPTSVSGTVGALTGYLPLQVRLCAPGSTLTLAPGRHTLTAATPGTFAVTDLSLATTNRPPTSAAARAVTIRSWQPDQRSSPSARERPPTWRSTRTTTPAGPPP
jgi:arabinofuranan 3-O-arabinosyltransferase